MACAINPFRQEKTIVKNQLDVVLAAGGNPTGVVCFDDASHRDEYVKIANSFMAADPTIEQFGFLEGVTHFQMSGGEFCGNAARVAAFLISERTGKSQGTFTISGFGGVVQYTVNSNNVRCVFPKYDFQKKNVKVLGLEAILIDLGGIVHVVLPDNIPFQNDAGYYQQMHFDVTEALGLRSKDAVGVIWQERRGDDIVIHPVVWVRGINSFFYETSCGSGTLATIIAHNDPRMKVYQVTGQAILAELAEDHTLAITSTIQRR